MQLVRLREGATRKLVDNSNEASKTVVYLDDISLKEEILT